LIGENNYGGRASPIRRKAAQILLDHIPGMLEFGHT
jgi:hypothetical protein